MEKSKKESEIHEFDVSQVARQLKLGNQNMSQLIQAIKTQFPAQQANLSALGIEYSTAGGTTVVVGDGYLVDWANTILSTNTGADDFIIAYDADSPANISSSNAMRAAGAGSFSTTIPTPLPFFNGLTIQPSSWSSNNVSVFYRLKSS